ncbi:HAD-IA family hydrolase [Pseudomonas sp. D5002]|jgi:putative hydrolase of the HAD superfamily|uniref:HAD-IA family hydrolase n=1 Tax=unclassified Pseudomonas TaxID=196821 RepID=UPI0008BEAB9E|nr:MULTISPECIES: HAD-IA family hydrolase [unclassified Pseudomonas]NWB10512.1 HAD-IA family hydrolase [Pseudomonas sp. D5002]SEN98942.1 putative hydrolase of the HAD superfamily [Pseudomonas sp. ok266]
MSFKQFKALTFDVVGTLIDFEAGILAHVREVAGEAGQARSDDEILKAYREARALPDSGWWPDDLERCYHLIAAKLGLPDNAEYARGLALAVQNFPAFPDSVAALKRLRKHFKLVATTNSQIWALDYMAKTLDEPFDVKVTVDDVRFEKPDPQFFAYTRGVLATQGIVFEQILHVAQSQYHDIGVAVDLGYQVCWIERRHAQKGSGGTLESEHTKPHYHYHTLAQLADAVEQELG